MALALIVVAGVAGVVYFASNRESNIGVAPEANIDHWHSAFLIHNCGTDLPPTANFETVDGLHTHGGGLFHLHPFNPAVAGRNATLGSYMSAAGATLTDDTYSSGFSDLVPVEMSEEAGCNGEEAVLQLAVWDNAFDATAEPRIITEDLADFAFESAGQAITLALVPEGAEVPRPPQDRIDNLATTGPGGPIVGVDEGENPIVETPLDESTDDAEDTGDADAEESDGEGDESDTEESDSDS